MQVKVIIRTVPRTDLEELECLNCGEIFWGEELKGCCSGKDCGCLGLPINPPICSRTCWEEYFPGKGFNYEAEEAIALQDFIDKKC